MYISNLYRFNDYDMIDVSISYYDRYEFWDIHKRTHYVGRTLKSICKKPYYYSKIFTPNYKNDEEMSRALFKVYSKDVCAFRRVHHKNNIGLLKFDGSYTLKMLTSRK